MEQARKKRATDIFKLKGNVYAFDSTTIPLCLSVFWWAKFRKKKGGVKAHVLYDLESQVPAFFHVTTASVHDSKAMKEIPYESDLTMYLAVDTMLSRNYTRFVWMNHTSLFERRRTYSTSARNGNADCLRMCLLTLLLNSRMWTLKKKYPERLRLVRFHDDEQDRDFAFLTNAFHLTSLEIANLYKNRWQIELSSNGSSSTSRLRNSGVLQRTLAEYRFARQS